MAVVRALVEGVSINASVRMTGVSKVTILKLLRDLGCACAACHDDRVRGLKPARIQCDEIWAFVHCKQKRAASALAAPRGAGDCWTWTAIDPDTKLIMSYLVGLRTEPDAAAFMLDLAGRITNIAHLTTVGLGVYPPAVCEAFGQEVNYAQLIKIYKSAQEHVRYSSAECVGCRIEYVEGAADPAHVSTSHVELSNLTMGCRCDDSRGPRTATVRKLKITDKRSPCFSRSTTSVGGICRLAEKRLRRPRESRIERGDGTN